MIRMIQSTSGLQAKSYFADALSKSDYYVDDQELSGKFNGAIAKKLGLEGNVTKESFFSLCENINPNTGKPLTQRNVNNRTIGYDINFHCPKSVSILHALSGDNHLLDAFDESVKETMQDMEADAKTRVRKKGDYDDRLTGELLYADFTHQTARPVAEQAPDPHLHCHCFTFNVTWDNEEKIFKAGQFRDIKRDMPYYQARFHKRLSDRLLNLGYSIKRTKKSFEVDGVPQNVIDLFSKRTDEIGRVAKEKGINNPKELGELGARTRSKKQKGLTMSMLKSNWRKQINELNKEEKGEGKKIIRNDPNRKNSKINVKECVDHALQHSFERASVVADRKILESAYRFGIGDPSANVERITNEFKQIETIIKVKEKSRFLCTTKEVLSEEKTMVELAQQGKGKFIPLFDKAPKLNLTGQQADAVQHVLTTANQVSIIRGAAGTGKTTLMKEAIHFMNKAGKIVYTFAPTAQASRGNLREEGFEDAETVAKLLSDKKLQDKLEDQILWVDEAGLLGTKDMKALLELATQKNARLILGGDTR
ncbi:MAG: MobF family relaxase, partial [Bacteroidota bacterium]